MRLASSPAFEPHLLRVVGLALWLVSALSSVWEVLARQPPDSPLHLGLLAGPIAQLATFAFALGTGMLLTGALWSSFYEAGEGRLVAVLLVAGSLFQVGALTYAASEGLLAVQLLDPRADARFTLYVRAVGHLSTFGGVFALLLRLLRRR
jgi:hypothetical protein